MKLFSTKLLDWRIEGDATIDPKPQPVKIEMRDTRIDVFFTKDRSLWIEQEAGVIKIRCYGPGDDEPTSIALSDTTLELLPT